MSREEDARGRRQLDLFGSPVRERRGSAPGAAPVPEAVERVAADLPRGIHLGTSSWSFPGWDGIVYDRAASKADLARRGLAAYARHPLLRAVGIDRTFYGPVPASTFAGYAESVPSDFRFLVKASGQCTMPHVRDSRGRAGGRNPLFLDASFAVNEVVGPFVEGLGAKAGPLVFQFPPLGAELTRQPSRFAGRLGEFLAALPRGPSYAVEPRDRGLLCPDYSAALESAGATHCLSIHPRMPAVAEQARFEDPACDRPLVARWMLHRGLGYEEAQRRYKPFSDLVDEDPESRSSLAALCLDRTARGRQVVVIANNKAEGSAPLTVFKLAESIVSRLRGTGV